MAAARKPSRCAISLAVLAMCASPVDADPRVVVWPQRPDDDVTGADRAVRESGATPIAFDPIGDRLRLLGARATTDEAAALDTVQIAFAAARAAYLKQQFTEMAAVLAVAETAALPTLARPRHRAVLWELEFQRGLAELARGDTAAAHARFAFALALDDQRIPRRELYGPAVAAAFVAVVDARAGVPPRPVVLRLSPRDARVVIDGMPVVAPATPRTLRPGLHVVLATAAGYAPSVAVVELDVNQPLALALAPATGGPIDRIGATWSEGTLDPAEASGWQAILDAAVSVGASQALVVAVDRERGEATARVVALGQTARSERGPTVAAAVAAVLGRPSAIPPPAGASLPARSRTADRDHASVLRSWWLWGVVSAVAASTIGVIVVMRRPDTVRILPPAAP